MNAIDFSAISATHPLTAFCESHGIRLRRDGATGRMVGRCPLHQERSASFTVYLDGHFYCFGCGRHGDVTDLCAALDGITLGEAAKKLALGAPATPLIYALPSLTATLAPKPEPYQLSNRELERMAAAAHRLATNPRLISRLVAKRPEWTTAAIENVALEGDIGYEPNCTFQQFRGPAILFAYSHGIKARWKDQIIDGKKKHAIRWLCGAASGELWRQSLLRQTHRVVCITEGETDALTLLSLGIEQPGQSLVLALSGAQILPKPEPFQGLDIAIGPDPDPAGQRAGKNLRALLNPFARSIRTVSTQGEAPNG